MARRADEVLRDMVGNMVLQVAELTAQLEAAQEALKVATEASKVGDPAKEQTL